MTDRTGRRLDAVLIILLLVAIGFIAWDNLVEPPGGDVAQSKALAEADGATAERLQPDSIAVLPLFNMSAVADNEYFSGGVHEEILTNLSRTEGLRVVSRTTALRYINSELSLSEIGDELRARYIVEGSVRRIANHVRVTVQLIDARDDAHLWARNYDRELVDVFATQSEVAREISNALLLEIRPDAVSVLDGMPTHSVKAYDLYIKANNIERGEAPTQDNYQRQRELLEAAVAEDPDFVEAWADLNAILDEICRTIIQENWFGETEAERDAVLAEARQAALRAIDRAVALDPDNVATLLARSTDFIAEQESTDYRLGRKKYIDRALELDPDNAEAWYTLGWWYRIAGDEHSATEPFLKAMELDPLHAHMVSGALIHFRDIGDEEMTKLLAERMVQIAPELGDKQLADIPVSAKLGNLLSLFAETSDQSIIDTYAETLAEANREIAGDELQPEERLEWHQAQLLQLQNDLEGLADFQVEALPEDPTFDRVNGFLFESHLVLAAQRVAGRLDDARLTARRMLDRGRHRELGLAQRDTQFVPVLVARLTLADDDEIEAMRRSASALLDDDDVISSPWSFVALGYLERDRAVESLLAKKALHPQWRATDYLAVNHITARHIITHPDMQAFYIEEGKWVHYLAERVPEYADQVK